MADTFKNGATIFGGIAFDSAWTNVITESFGSRPVLTLNSKDFNYTSGSAIGFQCKPNKVAAGGDIHGCEIQPRFADGIGGGSLVGANVSAILKGTTGDLTGEVHALEVEVDFNSVSAAPTRTITGDVSLLRFGGSNFNASMTFSGKKSMIQCAPANVGAWDAFIKFDATNTDIVLAAGTGDDSAATANGYATNPSGMKVIKVLVGASAFYVPLFSSNA